MSNIAKKTQTLIHHDYNNASYWGTPNLQSASNILTFIVDIRNPVRILTEMIADRIYDGEYCEELRNQVIKHTCNSLLAYVQQEKSLSGSSNENMNKAMQSLMDYQMSEIVASEIFHETETSVINCLMNVIPDIDDERKYKILNHKIVDNEDLHLIIEATDD